MLSCFDSKYAAACYAVRHTPHTPSAADARLVLLPTDAYMMLLSRHQLLCPPKATAIYCFQLLKPRAHARPGIPAAAAKPAEAVAAAAVPPPRHKAVNLSSRVLFVGGLPGAVTAGVLKQQLAAACAQWQPTRIEVRAE
jgi:hypothetical protein